MSLQNVSFRRLLTVVKQISVRSVPVQTVTTVQRKDPLLHPDPIQPAVTVSRHYRVANVETRWAMTNLPDFLVAANRVDVCHLCPHTTELCFPIVTVTQDGRLTHLNRNWIKAVKLLHGISQPLRVQKSWKTVCAWVSLGFGLASDFWHCL